MKKINATKHRLERNYGKGLVGLINENGHVSPDRLDWMMSSRIGGKPLVSGKRNLLNATFENLGVTSFNAADGKALIFGFVNGMQYVGLEGSDKSAPLPNESVPLTNCFAATYALVEDFEV